MKRVVSEFLKPKVQGKGVSWALMRNVCNTDTCEAKILVSHVWQENFDEFMENLDAQDDFDDNEAAWICFISIFQPTEGGLRTIF